jgi:SPP1 gp7 family putative phage head morphogenesis protein
MSFIQKLKTAIQVFREDAPDLTIQSTARGDYISAQYGITPYNPDALLSKKTYTIIDEMRHDDQVRSVMTLKKFARISPGWQIQPASSAKSDAAAAEFCKWNLENLAGTFNKHLFQLMSALDYGFSVTEKNWELSKEKGTTYEGKIILSTLKTRDPQYFTFYQDIYGNLEKEGIAQEQVSGQIQRMPIDKFILYSYQEEFDNLYGRSDYRAFYREWWIKSVILKFYAMWLERFPFPPTIGWYPPGTSEADIDALEDVLEHLQTGTIATLPMGVILDQLEISATASDAYKVAIDTMNRGITRGALVPDLLGYTESGSRGSYALGKKHFDVFIWILEDLGSSISTLITEQLLTPLTQYNFDAQAPTFQMISPEEDPEVKSKILKILLDAGVVDPSEEWVRDYLNVPQKNQPYIRKFQEYREAPLWVEESVARLPKQSVSAFRETPEPFPFRTLTEYEKATMIDYSETKFFLEKWVADISEKVSDNLFKNLAQVIPQIKEYFQNKDYRSVRNLYLDTKEIETEMENQFAEVYLLSMATGVSEMENSLNQRLTFQEDFAPTPSERLKQFIGRVPITKTEWLKLVSGFKSKAFTVAGFIESDIVDEIQRIVYKAIDEDWFITDLVKAIEQSQIQYTGKAWSLPPGTPMKKYHTNLVFRNAISDIYNGARRDLYFDPDVTDYVPALQYSAIMDERTRQTHREMDGRIYLKSDPVWQEWFPPNGHNCRCTIIPVTSNLNYVISQPVPAGVKPDAGFSKGTLI